jgi:glycosyltransferase involved in cell wall biosynthesis
MIHALQIGMEWQPEAPGSGIGRVYHGLARHLPQKGVDVSGLVTGPDPLPSAPPSIEAFAPASAALPRRLWALRSAARERLRDDDIDLVAAHFALYALSLAGLTHDRPLVIHFHGPWAGESDAEGEPAWTVRAKAALERLVYRRATRFIVLSSAFRTALVDRYDVAPDRVRIVPGGVAADRFDPGLSRRAARERLSWPTDRPIVLSVRRLVRRTGLPRLVDAIAHVRDRVPEIQLYIAGKGPLRAELARQIRDQGLSNHAELLGFVPDAELPLAYRAADLSVVPTVAHEGFGLVVVESLAAGTPALVTPVGGLPEIVSDLSEDLLLPDGRPATIADRIASVLTGPTSLPDAAACRRYVRGRYDWPTIAQQVRDVYAEVVTP